MIHLPNNTLLQGGKYMIVRHLSSGGFGNTYEGVHAMMDTPVAIKEFFVKDFCNRDEQTSQVTVGTQSKVELVQKLRLKFVDEAKALYKMQHPNIVRVLDIFEENGTAYYVMDYIDGQSLHDIVMKRGSLPVQDVLGYVEQIASALQYVHSQHRLHLDIKPGNIMVDNEGVVKLIDFGASKQYDEVDGENTSTLLGKTPGYAPIEQMGNTVRSFTPATDIYALGATLYKCLTGVTPPDATFIASGDELDPLPSSIPENIRNAVCQAMLTNKMKRPQSVEEFMDILRSSAEVVRYEPAVDNEEATIIDSDFNAPNVVSNQNDKNIHPQQISSKTFTVNGVSFDMMKVEAGTFTMGATSEMGVPWAAEMPPHQVTLTNDYYIGKTEVTQALWKAVMGNNPSFFRGDNLPVENVSWNDCIEFISKLNSITDQNFSLPTEAEWEFAARGGNNSKHYQYSGSNNLGEVAWYRENSGDETHSVGAKQPNELGIYDMSGNVSEWCFDCFDDYSSNSQINPIGPNNTSVRAMRGGDWNDDGWGCRSSYRDYQGDDYSCYTIGFRLALVVSHNVQNVEIVESEVSSKTITVNGVSFDMMKVEAGTFIMGATSEMVYPHNDELPIHQVTLSNDYYIGKTEVTQALWNAVMGKKWFGLGDNNPSFFKGDNLPVENVSWNDCMQFISKLDSLTGLHFWLPTEAQWEFAARGGNYSKRYQYSGSNNVNDVAWYEGNSGGKTHMVGTKQPNELGIYDMSGNVCEWCSDWYDKYSSNKQTNPTGPIASFHRVARGGSFLSDARKCHLSTRNHFPSGTSMRDLGFRLVLVP